MYDTSSSEEEEAVQYHVRRRRTFRPRINFEIVDPFAFKEKFRINSDTFELIVEKIGRYLQHPTKRNYALSPVEQLKIALHWMGNGSQYHGVGDMHGVHKSSVQRSLSRVSDAILEHLFGEEVRWPADSSMIPSKFFRMAGFPRVGGCVDGSLIPIDGPTQNEPAFVDRHGNHSINTLVVSGPQLEFLYANAMWPGSVHDARVLRNSSLDHAWGEGWRPFPNAVLLGDSGYPLKEWLLTPVWNGEPSDGVRRFMRRHKCTRSVVERSLGCLKEKFPCLNHLRLAPEFAARVFLTATAIYNIENRLHRPNDDNLAYEDDIYAEAIQEMDEDAPASARAVLQDFINLFENE